MRSELIQFSKELTEKKIMFPVSYITFENVSAAKEQVASLIQYIEKITNKIKKRNSLDELKTNEVIRKYRDFYWHYLGIDPTKTRPASEALIRRLLANKKVPEISNIVDLINWVSIDTLIPLGAYDMKKIKLPLLLRFAKMGEPFFPIGGELMSLKGKEIILCDNSGLVMFLYPHRDSEISKITLETKEMLLVACGVPEISPKSLEYTLEKFKDLLIEINDAKISYSKILTIPV